TLIRILTEKRFLRQTNQDRPFLYESVRSFDEVSVNLVDDLVKRVFRGSKEKLLISLFGQQEQLSDGDRELLEDFLREQDQ
ncbi:MAG: BlaI/MecI/CopY family transcriptional regulator, partial [Planctomycetota bacterium]|nr:BlaI/MecI/CopY family transcriptional regulator [Planctomycetota bacterium]